VGQEGEPSTLADLNDGVLPRVIEAQRILYRYEWSHSQGALKLGCGHVTYPEFSHVPFIA
jgi:hypothetical protein